MWLQGFENFKIPKDAMSRISEADSEKNRFLLSKGVEKDYSAFLHLELIKFLKKCEDFEEVDDGVIEVKLKGRKLRFIVEKLSAEATRKYIIDPSDDTDVVVVVRPKGMTKKETEQQLSAANKSSMDVRPPRMNNLFALLDKNNWSVECVIHNLLKGVVEVTWELIKNILAQYLFTYIQ